MPESVLELRAGSATVRLRYVSEPPLIFILASDSAAQWPAHVLRLGWAEGTREGERFSGPASMVTNRSTRERVLARLREESGQERTERWFSHPGPLLVVRIGADVANPDPFGRWIGDEFDIAAEAYAERLDHNPVERQWRLRSIELLSRTFAQPGRLLEIGPGPGTETLPMLRLGHRVAAVDVSGRMLDLLRNRARAEGLEHQLDARILRCRDLSSLVTDAGPGSFDGAYSTFGAVNLEPDLTPVADGLAQLLKPGSRLVLGTYNRHAIMEPLVALARGHFRQSLARQHAPALVGSHRFSLDVYFRSAGDLERTFSRGFVPRGCQSVGVIVPPPNFVPRVDHLGLRWDRLDRWDRWWGALPPLSCMGDQVFVVLERTRDT
ncbi:MAG TPA: class I SAM-dependent methyltransferase [Thermoplasmata archaeon]|nr:class I SAM-dependent methyltransferase [Thermoplasmata archaeon]